MRAAIINFLPSYPRLKSCVVLVKARRLEYHSKFESAGPRQPHRCIRGVLMALSNVVCDRSFVLINRILFLVFRMPVRVAFIRYKYDPYGGAERFTHVLADALAKNG